ncbi:MAG: DMT family transporter [Xanthomonadales bacterium]|jgi:drug/metabolite transporter (DMT)-like permease|nr:DMT family transporter [Xanthomonadales bacterium]
MTLHQASGRWRLGLALAVATALFWASLPIALKRVLTVLDPYTITWFRFLFAALATLAWLAWRGQLDQFRGLQRGHRLLLAVAALGLIGNYLGYLLALDHTTPANAQLLIQMAPLLFALGGILVFREAVSAGQWLGYALIVGGLVLFAGEQQAAAAQPERYLLGIGLMLMAAVTWAGYALAQKQLLQRLGSQAILLVIYVAAALLLLPLAAPVSLAKLDGGDWLALLYCAFNTIFAYGCFAAAIEHWEASRVGAVLATTPLLTLVFSGTLALFAPGFVGAENLGPWTVAGALLVVGGSALASLLKPKPAHKT